MICHWNSGATQTENELFAKEGNKDRAAGIIEQFQSPTERGRSDRQRGLAMLCSQRSMTTRPLIFPVRISAAKDGTSSNLA
jgi:hypothetical protein